MYYVIKRQPESTSKCFIGFKVPKYTSSRSSDNVIFEFIKDGKTTRKWIKKDEIILLTEDKDFFMKTMEQFKSVEEIQQKLVDTARKKLDESMETFTENVNAELNEFNEIRDSDDIPCILKDL